VLGSLSNKSAAKTEYFAQQHRLNNVCVQ